MSRVLVTGATGFLGKHLVIRLASEGNIVHALYRSEEKIAGWEHENIRFFKGSLTDRESLERAMEGCGYVYHMAAYAAVWTPDSRKFYEENVQGTVNLLEAARKQGVEKIVYTSTAGVLGPSSNGPNTEEKNFKGDHLTHYDRSKAMAEEKVMGYVESGLRVVVLNPTRIFGPGNLSRSNSLTMMASKYIKGKWKVIPGKGNSLGNYVYVDDVVDCHLLAMEKGRSGERYLVAGENLSFNEFFGTLRKLSGVNYRLYKMPVFLMMFVARVFLTLARISGWSPPIIPAFVRRYNNDWEVSCNKAMKELAYNPISFEDGMRKTIEWIRE